MVFNFRGSIDINGKEASWVIAYIARKTEELKEDGKGRVTLRVEPDGYVGFYTEDQH